MIGEVPTVSFVSYLGGLLAASRILRWRIGGPGSGFRTDDRGVGRPGATSCQVVYEDDHVIHNTQLAAASAGVTSFGSLMAICAALSDSALR